MSRRRRPLEHGKLMAVTLVCFSCRMKTISDLAMGEPQTAADLTMLPLSGNPAAALTFLLVDQALRLLRLLNERKVLTSRVVAEEFGVTLRTAQRYLLYLSALPCVITDEEKHTYSLTSDYVVSDKILNVSEMALVCALIDYAVHIFGPEHSKFLTSLKHRIFRMPDVYQIVKDEAIDMEKVASVQLDLERHVKNREVISFTYRKSGKRYTAEPYRILYTGGFWYLAARHDGTLDLLIENAGGYWILDHKTDATNDSAARFPVYHPQLACSAEVIRKAFPGKPVLGAGIHWISLGAMTLLPLP